MVTSTLKKLLKTQFCRPTVPFLFEMLVETNTFITPYHITIASNILPRDKGSIYVRLECVNVTYCLKQVTLRDHMLIFSVLHSLL